MRLRRRLLICVLLVAALHAPAHRLDEYLQAARVAVASDRIDLSMDLTPGVAVASQVLAAIDTNRDGEISDGEQEDYALRLLEELRARLDGKDVGLTLVERAFPAVQEMKSGVGVIRIKATAALAPLSAGRHIFQLTNAHLPAISVYLVNALVPRDRAIEITRQTRDELQKDYRLMFTVSPAAPERPVVTGTGTRRDVLPAGRKDRTLQSKNP